MEAIRWQLMQDLFHEALVLAASERQSFLEGRCPGDPGLVREVLELLAEDERTASLLDRPLGILAGALLHDAPHVSPGSRFGPYQVRSLLGEGGMGVVYLAERPDLAMQAAIKVLRDAWLSPARRARFAAEQRTLARLEHPAIARLYEADVLPDGTPWFAMEYVAGEPITEYCARRRLSLRARLRLFRQACEAVQFAHGQLVVHRDLKPSNVLVRRDGTVKLLDFGIAKQLESLDDTVGQTGTLSRLMTPAYAAPEQVLGEAVGVPADVYSLGVMLYELLTGLLPRPRSGRTPTDPVASVPGQEPVRPSAAARRAQGTAGAPQALVTLRRSDWDDLDALCLTALDPDRTRRYRTVEALMRDLDNFLDGRPLLARPVSAGYRLGKFVRRHRGMLAAAAGVLLLVAGVTGLYTAGLAHARDEALMEAARAQRIQRFTLSLFAADDNAGPPDSLRVSTLLERGVQEAAQLQQEPAVQTELLATLGGVFRELGQLSRSDSLLEAALRRTGARGRSNEIRRAATLVSLGQLRSDQARYDEAEAAVRQALVIDRRWLAPADPAALDAREALGHVLVERGSYAAALPILEEVVRMRGDPGAPLDAFAGSLSELAAAHFYAGNFATSDSLNVRALAIYRRLHGDRHPKVADMLVNRGAIQQEQGDYRAAEQYFRQALGITRAWYGDGHPEVAALQTMVARSLLFQERYDEATALLRTALAIRERAFGPMHPQVASTVNELGAIALQRDQYDTAEAAFRRMLAIYRAAYGRHYLIGTATANLASVYLARHQYAEAEPLLREAIRIFQETQGPEHLNVGIARIKLGRSLLRQRRFQDAVRESAEGYRIVGMQASPGVSWLVAARTDLAAALDTLGRPDEATRFRAEAERVASAK